MQHTPYPTHALHSHTATARPSQKLMRYAPYLLIALTLLLTACRGDDVLVVPEVKTELPRYGSATQPVAGFYLLNEGNMGSNKATLDFADLTTGQYHRNIFGARNPSVPFALGDVGNDLLHYGSKLYVVVNASHLIEVMDASTGLHLGQVRVQNVRHLAAHAGKVYATSYAGPIDLSQNSTLGQIVEIDTATHAITRRTTVGYQPDGLAVLGGKLYVANSGGYRRPHYDTRLMRIDLTTLEVEASLHVAPNLHHVVASPSGMLYVSSRGDYGDAPSRFFRIDPATFIVADTIEQAVSSWWLHGDSLYILGSSYHEATRDYTLSTALYDTRAQRLLRSPLLPEAVQQQWQRPYAIAVHPDLEHLYVADATNYVSNGVLRAYSPTGEALWQVTTGDIPGHFCFVPQHRLASTASPSTASTADRKPTRVYDYTPAPGQFVNKLPVAHAGEPADSIRARVLAALRAEQLITLGGFGGSVTVGFDHRIINRPDMAELRIRGNAFEGSSEPGIVQVGVDHNGNGRPDAGEWYELRSSAHNHAATIAHYTISYTPPTSSTADIAWTDNQGRQGFVYRNAFHTQSYWPLWLPAVAYSLSGTHLPALVYNRGTDDAPYWVSPAVEGSYVDNNAGETLFDLDWATDGTGQGVRLTHIDFVRIYSATNQQAGWLGELSTEVATIEAVY